ncbi:MAG: DNA polymerase III subunit beta [Rubrivivax sp. SCN 71-131]|jgi:predicted nucleotidyltransferase|nr:MAG: DNA polymerase III subunit beta [Rubrivivax sp. SCN 71-131]
MLESSLLERVRTVLTALPEIELAFVFGSAAKGRLRVDSDLDVAVQTREPLDAAAKFALIGDLALATGRAVDLIELGSAGTALLGQILNHGQRVLGSEAEHARLLTRYLIDVADFMPCVERLQRERRRAWIGR